MNTQGFLNFLSMGGYSFYVWTAYSLTFAILFGHFYVARRYAKKVRQAIKK